jgi:hypothetical protein
MKFVILQKKGSVEVAVFISSPPEKEREQMVQHLKSLALQEEAVSP